MLHRGIKFVHVAVLASSALLAFLFLRGLDEDGVLGNSALVWVFDSEDSTSGAHAAQAVAAFATDHGTTVAREVPDIRDPERHRHLYLAPGGSQSAAAAWLDKGYPAFSMSYKTDVHPIAEIGQRDPRGYYYVFGTPADADALVAQFASLGLHASVTYPLSYTALAATYTHGALYWSFWTIALAAVAMTGASVLLSAKAYGVLRLQGMSFADIFVRDLRQLAVFWLVALSAVATTVLIALWFYNGLAWVGLFAAIAAGFVGFLVLLTLAAHAAVLAMTFKVDVLGSLKGELPARTASISVYLVRIPALLLALGIATDVATASQDVLARQESREAYVKVADAVTIRLNGSLPSETDQMIKRLGPWLRQADKEGQVIVAGRRDLQHINEGARLPAGEVLIVNESFLADQAVLDPAGQRYRPLTRDGRAPEKSPVRLILPDSLKSYASKITTGVLDVLYSDTARPIRVETLRLKTGQRLFGYNSGSQVYNAAHAPTEDRSLVHDPVVVVVPNGSTFLSDDTYTAFASQEGVIFLHSAAVLDAMKADKDGKLQTYVAALRPIGENSALKLRDAVNELRLDLFNLAVAVIVLLIAGVGVCIIYSRKNAQVIFVRHISGWRYAATHRFIIAVEVALAALLATRVPFKVWLQNQKLQKFVDAGIPAPFPPAHVTALDLSVIAGLVGFELSAVLIALAVFHGRIVKEKATQS